MSVTLALDTTGKVCMVSTDVSPRLPTSFNGTSLTQVTLTDVQATAYYAATAAPCAGVIFDGSNFTVIPNDIIVFQDLL